MAQESRPLADANWTDSEFRDRFVQDRGVQGDFDGSAYRVTLPTNSDVAQLGSTTQDSLAVVAGFSHKIPQGTSEGVTIPVATSARTDLVVLRYDPAHVGEPGPVRLVRVAGSGTAIPSGYPLPTGAEDLPLWAITRQPSQALSQATVVDRRLWRQQMVVAATLTAGQAVLQPLGTRMLAAGQWYQRQMVGSSPDWVRDQAPRVKMYRTGSTGYPANSWISVPFDTTVPDETLNAGDFTWSPGSRTITINRQGRYLVEAVGRLTNEGAVRVTTSTGVTFCAGEINQPLGMASFCGSLTFPAGATLKMEQFAYFAGTNDAAGASLTVTRMD